MDRAPTALMENQAEGKTAGFVFGWLFDFKHWNQYST
jgi:hypothetical protein